jgi:Phosphatidylglycerophosphatase A and related proteins
MQPGPRTQPALLQPTPSWVFSNLWRIIAFGFGSGLLRPAPGTWGTLLAWLLWAVLLSRCPDIVVAAVLVLGFLVGCVACDRSGRALGQPDHGGMVWDEIIAFWLVLWLTPDYLVAQAIAFLVFRLFDIAKPQPVRYFDRHVKGGLGVMLDDLIAAAYSLLVMAILVTLGVFA